jgi:putative ABC transport system permease protein
MSAGTLCCLFYFLLAVVQITPWYEPQYFVPIAGMIVGNSMTGISLGIKSLTEGMTTQKNLVEEALVLGATPKIATRDIINSTFDGAIMPTVNSMLGMGIVFLPGMMTGQILSGIAPTTAIAYQIAIMLGILGSVSLSVILMLVLGYRTFFNEQDQLVDLGS